MQRLPKRQSNKTLEKTRSCGTSLNRNKENSGRPRISGSEENIEIVGIC